MTGSLTVVKDGHECPDCGRLHLTLAQHQEMQKRWHNCAHCGELVGEDYQLKDEVWTETGLNYDGGRLHLPCVEHLIGRRLTIDDLHPTAGVNELLWFFLRRV